MTVLVVCLRICVFNIQRDLIDFQPDEYFFFSLSVPPSYAYFALNKDISIIYKHKVITDTALKSFFI